MQSSRYHFWADISVVDSFQLIARMKGMRNSIMTTNKLVKALKKNNKLIVSADDQYIYIGRLSFNYGKPFLFVPVKASKLAQCEFDGGLPEVDLQKFIWSKLDAFFTTNKSQGAQ